MTWLARRLARGGGRAEAVRWALVVLGASLATVLLLSAALVSAVPGGFDSATGGLPGVAYRTELLDQSGLRPGVVTALVLMVVPVLVFLGMCARIAAAQRDHRLAAVRLAGADPGQVRLLAAVDTAVPAAAGALIGLLAVAVGKGLLESSYQRNEAVLGAARALPTDVPLPPVRTLLVLLLVPALSAASAVLALRRVETTPLGVSRRARPAPGAGGFAVLLVGVVAAVWAPLLGDAALLPLTLGAALLMLGLVSSSSWLTARTGAVAARFARRPTLLLAGRRLQADPRAQGRALAGVVLAVLVASAAAVLREVTLRGADPGDEFYRNAYDLVDLALLVALVVAAAGLVVAACEAVLERRRTLASLSAGGVPLAVLRRAVLLQSLLPAVPAVLLAAAVGTAATQPFAGAMDGTFVVPTGRLLAIVGLALLAVAAASVVTLPLVHQAVQPSELRVA